ncbi:MAG: hypothetical protein HYX69_19360 [Planctomycetia bacterium]|nr:hypothetical protein [Planctomycetia bacterium]
MALSTLCLVAANGRAAPLDLTKAVVVEAADASPRERKAVDMLVDDVERRTQVRLPRGTKWPEAGGPAIVVGKAAGAAAFAGRFADAIITDVGPAGAEGYSFRVKQDKAGPAVFVFANDERGVLFGIGRLLRVLKMTPGKIAIDSAVNIATAPAYPVRGHQLGYRPKTNSYDAWDLKLWEQYYRDLAVFGANCVELLPPRTDDAATSPHFPLPQLDMMEGMSRLADDYGLDVWIWYPAMDRDYSDPATVAFALEEWGNVFKRLPRIDAVFVPGGDPGHTQPKFLMALLEKETEVLHRTHPKAAMWMSPQGFTKTWFDEFLEILQHEQPKWLTGIVFGPQVRMPLPKLREAVPRQYPIRHYPDITHSRQCQYPVPDWDVAYAVTESRECINPRPLGEATICRLLSPYTIGALTYSEGCNDDVNKALWSVLSWDPKTPVVDILRDYAGYYIGERYRDDFAQGLLALEQNWRGSLAANAAVETTLEQFQSMERQATPEDLHNWRFQQALYRAYYDAYVRRRLLAENEVEAQALERLRAAGQSAGGTMTAMAEAEAILDAAVPPRVAPDLKARVFELADALFASIRMQTSVERYKAIAVDRGATLDTIDYPLNNRRWLKDRFTGLRKLSDESQRLRGLAAIVDWTNPGPGGFYDDLGNPSRQPHLVVGEGFERDPAFLASSHAGFAGPDQVREKADGIAGAWRVSWLDHAESLLDAPLSMRYTDLDPTAEYRLRVVYAGDGPRKKIRLEADGGIEIHPFITKPRPVAPIEFDIPAAATRSGELALHWYREPGMGDNGRGCQVSEAWLMKKRPAGRKR